MRRTLLIAEAVRRLPTDTGDARTDTREARRSYGRRSRPAAGAGPAGSRGRRHAWRIKALESRGRRPPGFVAFNTDSKSWRENSEDDCRKASNGRCGTGPAAGRLWPDAGHSAQAQEAMGHSRRRRDRLTSARSVLSARATRTYPPTLTVLTTTLVTVATSRGPAQRTTVEVLNLESRCAKSETGINPSRLIDGTGTTNNRGPWNPTDHNNDNTALLTAARHLTSCSRTTDMFRTPRRSRPSTATEIQVKLHAGRHARALRHHRDHDWWTT